MNINMTGSKIVNSNVMNNIHGEAARNIEVEIIDTEIYNSDILSDLSDAQINDTVGRLKEQMKEMDPSCDEYLPVQKTLNEIDKNPTRIRDILKKHFPELIVGTLANILSSFVH